MDAGNLDGGPVKVFASIGSLQDIHNVLRERFEALEFSRATIDAAAGLAHGHAAKLFAEPPIKRFGDLTFFTTIEAAGLRLVLVEDPAAMERVKEHPKRVRSQIRQRVSQRMLESVKSLLFAEMGRAGGKVRAATMSATLASKIGRKAGRARMRRLTKEQRSALAGLAAKARWARSRKSA
jgi:hypothetical protein